MKKKLLISISFLLVSAMQFVKAQGIENETAKKKAHYFIGTLTGHVTDKNNGTPLAGVTVYIPDLRVGGVTDSVGKYALKYLPEGNFLVEARMIGYKTVTKNVTITDVSSENFELEISAVEEGEVVITGLTKATRIKRNPVPASKGIGFLGLCPAVARQK